MVYELYGEIHKFGKKVLHKMHAPMFRLVNVPLSLLYNGRLFVLSEDNYVFFNEKAENDGEIAPDYIFPVENVVAANSFSRLENTFSFSKKRKASFGVSKNDAVKYWEEFINNSVIPEGYRNAGLSYTGYVLEASSWCLPSWVWTNAAKVRMYCKCGEKDKARDLTDLLVSLQEPDGGWIVRFDFDSKGAIPVLAPNDSAYIANNACIEMYLSCKERKYLEAAELCAKWIMKTSNSDGMIYSGFNLRDSVWNEKYNIVDVGFTAGLFCRLYKITGERTYLEFINNFISRYLELFYIENKGFATSIDEKGKKRGGMFARGQAWALEGIIPYYNITHDKYIKEIIDNTINTLLCSQTCDGGWHYNLSRKLMGIDCKAVPVIAYNLYLWYLVNSDRIDCKDAAKKAISWCQKHTVNEGNGKGGIFSYSIEGAVVHNMYTSTAFVYACAYATELFYLLYEG